MFTELFAKYTCTNCQEDISGIRVHCVVCTDFELCLACFAAGAEIGPHRNDHSYQFMDSGILSIFRGKSGWSAREELHLLDAIEQYGFGNWEDISKHIETRTPEEAKDEYVSKFLNGTIGRHTWQTAVDQRPILTDHTSDDTGPLSQLLIQKLPPMDCTAEEAAALGYMPNRDDFEREYDPTAEQLVSTLSLQPDDEDVDMLLKLAQVDIYTRRLRERARRKRVVRDYQLIANFFRGNMKRARQTRDQREFRERLRTYSQFYTSLEFERLISSLERERALRIRLSELNRYRWNGIQRVDECVHFEQHVAAAQYRNTGPYGHGRTLACIIGPNGQSITGCIRQILTGQPKQRRLWRDRQRGILGVGQRNGPNGSGVVSGSGECDPRGTIDGGIGKKKRKRRPKLKFHRPKAHAPHRRPGLLRRLIQQQKLLG
ncbi:transcriptional adapter 2B isoform X2 [Anopheles moucheti]|uniref:transcriptional adapter 2B isoform X2 n=1 Tax=Anopheles moucheti TaxID=186751 RepID=UPI0022F03538|nr:transcriptional adapter 2B isoform X2 [Anopheles moucheti]